MVGYSNPAAWALFDWFDACDLRMMKVNLKNHIFVSKPSLTATIKIKVNNIKHCNKSYRCITIYFHFAKQLMMDCYAYQKLNGDLILLNNKKEKSEDNN